MREVKLRFGELTPATNVRLPTNLLERSLKKTRQILEHNSAATGLEICGWDRKGKAGVGRNNAQRAFLNQQSQIYFYNIKACLTV